jgi:hypothetical protein
MGGANPFAAPNSINGGEGFVSGPKWVDLLDRLIVLKPVEKKIDQPIKDNPGQLQTFYACDLTVLDGGTLTVVVPARAAQGDKPALPEQRTEHETPATFPKWFAYGAGVTVKLDGLAKAGLPLLLGTVKRCPTSVGYRSGKTHVDTAAEWETWRQAIIAGRDMPKPQFSWGLINATPEQTSVALAWWNSK